MLRFFDVNYVDSDMEDDIPYSKGKKVYVYLEKGDQEFVFDAGNLILKTYHKRNMNLDTFIRFKIDAESGNLKFRVSEDYSQLMIL